MLKGSSGHTDKKRKKSFPRVMYKEKPEGSGCKVIYEEGLPNTRGNAQIFSHI
jgi:hypothetical protein